MEILFVRHAQSANNALGAYGENDTRRSEDPSLTELGFRQLPYLSRYLEEQKEAFGVTHMYVSPHLRALQTAKPVAETLGLQPRVWHLIHESGGIYLADRESGKTEGKPGVTRQFIEENFPGYQISVEITDSGWWNRPFEMREQRPLRAIQALDSLVQQHADTEDVVLLVSHAGFFNHLINLMVNNLYRVNYWFEMNNVGLSHMVYRVLDDPPVHQSRWMIDYTNRTSFLPVDLIT